MDQDWYDDTMTRGQVGQEDRGRCGCAWEWLGSRAGNQGAASAQQGGIITATLYSWAANHPSLPTLPPPALPCIFIKTKHFFLKHFREGFSVAWAWPCTIQYFLKLISFEWMKGISSEWTIFLIEQDPLTKMNMCLNSYYFAKTNWTNYWINQRFRAQTMDPV